MRTEVEINCLDFVNGNMVDVEVFDKDVLKGVTLMQFRTECAGAYLSGYGIWCSGTWNHILI